MSGVVAIFFLPEALHDERYFCILERFDPGSGDFSARCCPGNGLILPAYFPKTSIGWYNSVMVFTVSCSHLPLSD